MVGADRWAEPMPGYPATDKSYRWPCAILAYGFAIPRRSHCTPRQIRIVAVWHRRRDDASCGSSPLPRCSVMRCKEIDVTVSFSLIRLISHFARQQPVDRRLDRAIMTTSTPSPKLLRTVDLIRKTSVSSPGPIPRMMRDPVNHRRMSVS